MTERRVAVRVAGVLALTAPLALGLLAAAPAASASGTITSPGNQATYTSNTTVGISATASGTSGTDLKLADPASGATVTVAHVDGTLTGTSATTLSYALDTGCWTFPSSSCSGYVPAPNGSWTVSVTGGTSRLFTLSIPPRTPTGFTAQGSGSRQVTLGWTKGAEPDLASYTLYDGAGSVLSDGISAGAACNGSACSYVLTYPSDAPGRHDYALSAHRKTCPSCAQTLESGRTAASATLDNPPPPPPPPPASTQPTPTSSASTAPASGSSATPSGTATGTTASGTPSSSPGASPGSTSPAKGAPKPAAGTTAPARPAGSIPPFTPPVVSQQRAPALSFNRFSPGAAKLPALPSTDLPTLAEPPLPLGTYKPVLPYKPQVAQKPVTVALQARGTVSQVSHVVSTALDSAQLARSLAGALVLLLAGAHLRRFLSHGSSD